MEKEHEIVRAVYGAKEDNQAADDLIRRYIPFIRAEGSKFLGRFCTDNDDEYSIAMIAFHEAIMEYSRERGAFLKYAGLLIRSRLTDYARKESRHQGNLSLDEPGEEDERTLLEQVADEFYGVFQEKNLICQVEAEEDLRVYGDADKLARVFDNILRNAVSYCYSDTMIRIEATHTEEGNVITFSNRGNQIPPEKLETIFEKFYRLDEARTTSTGGAGLGLAIAKKIVELHGGDIKATSDEKETHFIVTLPDKQMGEKDEIYSHSRRPSRGRTRGLKSRK